MTIQKRRNRKGKERERIPQRRIGLKLATVQEVWGEWLRRGGQVKLEALESDDEEPGGSRAACVQWRGQPRGSMASNSIFESLSTFQPCFTRESANHKDMVELKQTG
ncbi:hypothetical protein AALO_G00224880 [Alosa alosa]|uniref:Uncharacterized protein n=1 Tax=Alosa alosa TaxID=278164 RepID=A0AAV6FYA3_9TELE|nr:hypothetical protein AALO_G00224880 [Alosa alosa]